METNCHSPFKNCNAAALEILSKAEKHRLYTPGEYLFKENEEFSNIYYILSGILKITRRNGKQEHITGFLKSGDTLGLDCLTSQAALYSSSAMALTNTEAIFIPRTEFVKAISADPMLNLRIMQIMCKQIERLESHISQIVHKPLAARLAQILIMMAGDGLPSTDRTVEFELSEAQLASYVRSTQPSVRRMLKEFSKRKIIDISGSKIHMNDPELLKQMIIA